MQNTRSHPRAIELESTFYLDFCIIHLHQHREVILNRGHRYTWEVTQGAITGALLTIPYPNF